MADEFSTETELLVRPDPRSLRSTRRTIEDELGDITVDVTASTKGASGQMGPQPRNPQTGQFIKRQGQETRLLNLVQIGEQNLELNEERNDLLKELIDETESGNFTKAKKGGKGMLGAGIALGGLVAFLGPAIVNSVSSALSGAGNAIQNAIGEINIEARDLIAGGASITAGSLIQSRAVIGASDVITAPTGITVTDVITAGAAIAAADLIDTQAVIGASALIDTKLAITPAMLVEAAAVVGATDIITTGAIIGASDVIAQKVSLAPSDIIDTSGGAIDLEQIILGAVVGGAAGITASGLFGGGQAGRAGGGGRGVGAGGLFSMIPALIGAQAERMGMTDILPDNRGNQTGTGAGGMAMFMPQALINQARGSDGSSESARDRSNNRQSGDLTITNEMTVGRRSDREIERIVDRKLSQFRRELLRELR